jgi:hypothetical protein
MTCEAELLMACGNVAFLGCCAWVWRELGRRGINGACHLCVALLASERVADWGPLPEEGQDPVALWRWGLGIAFGSVFLYVLHHVGELIVAARAARDARGTNG